MSLSLGLYVFSANPRGSANRAFLVLMLAFMLWGLPEAVSRSLPADASPAVVEAVVRSVWWGISLVPSAVMHLALAYPEASEALRRRWVLALVYAPWPAWIFFESATDVVIDGVSSNPFGPAASVSEAYVVPALLFAISLYASTALFVRAWWRVRPGRARRMLGIVAAGLVLGTVPAGVTDLFYPLLSPTLAWLVPGLPVLDAPLGLGSLYTLVWSVVIAFAIARYRYLSIEPVLEARAPSARRHGLEAGANYLILEPGRTTALGAFREIVVRTPGLCVTGLPPQRVAERFGLARTPVAWITNASGEGRSIRPGAFDFELLHTITKFLRENPGTAVLLDDLDYLAELAGFDAVARFLRKVTNQASASGGTVLVAAGLGTFSAEEIAVLRGTVDHVIEVLQGPPGVSVAEGDHVLLLVSSQEVPSALGAAGARGGLLLTTEHPSKARRRFGDGYSVLWLTESSDGSAASARPTSLDAEAKRALSNYVAAHRGSDVVLVGIEQLAVFTDFRSILSFVKDAIDIASLGGCRLFATLSPEALPSRAAARIARRFDAPSGPALRIPGGPSTAALGSRILYRGPVS